jgi:hypothetical protein
MFTAKETLGSPYAAIAWQQWQEVFTYFQPLLLFESDRISVTAEGLIAIAQYFDTRYPVSVPVSALPLAPVAPSLDPENASASPLSLVRLRQKKTYSLYSDVLESLEQVSFWRRVNKSALVNLAVEQLMATYPESQIPIP